MEGNVYMDRMKLNEGPVRDAIGSYNVGQYVKLYERARKRLNKNADPGHSARVTLGDKVVEVTPNYANKNLNPGTAAGAIVATLIYVGETYIPIAPFFGDTEVTSVEQTSNGAVYDVNVDAIFPQEGRFRALMESGQGPQSLITEDFEMQSDAEIFNKKPLQTTWQYQVKVKTEQ